MKPVVLMVTPTLGEKEACGVGLYGKHWGEALLHLQDYEFNLMYTDSIEDTLVVLQEISPDIVLYMCHPVASPWMAHPLIKRLFPKIKHVNICVDLIPDQDALDVYSEASPPGGFKYHLLVNPCLTGNKNVVISNKLLAPDPTVKYVDRGVPVIGYHGFGLSYKGIARLAKTINDEFDDCIFRLHMAKSWFCDKDGKEIEQRKAEISSIITKPGITVEYSHNMMDAQELVNWLAQNTINCYFADNVKSALASSTDYALAAKRPIAVSRANYYKDFFDCSPSVIIHEPHTLSEIIQNGFTPIEGLYKKYSKESFLQNWSAAIKYFLSL